MQRFPARIQIAATRCLLQSKDVYMKPKNFQPSFIIQLGLSRSEQPCVLMAQTDDAETCLQFEATAKLFIVLLLFSSSAKQS